MRCIYIKNWDKIYLPSHLKPAVVGARFKNFNWKIGMSWKYDDFVVETKSCIDYVQNIVETSEKKEVKK